MNIWMITADYQGSPDSVQIGVADHEVIAWDMVSSWLAKEICEGAMDLTVPERPWNSGLPATQDIVDEWAVGLTAIADEVGVHVSVSPHDVNILTPIIN